MPGRNLNASGLVPSSTILAMYASTNMQTYCHVSCSVPGVTVQVVFVMSPQAYGLHIPRLGVPRLKRTASQHRSPKKLEYAMVIRANHQRWEHYPQLQLFAAITYEQPTAVHTQRDFHSTNNDDRRNERAMRTI